MSHSPSSPTAANPAPTAPPPPSAREAIAAAAQARLASARQGGTSSEAEAQRAKDEADHLLLCRRIVDLQIRRDNAYDKAFECLKTLDTLLSNILSHPTEEKYRSFKSENPRLQRSVLSVPGGTDYLLQAGFGTRTVEFKQQWYLHSSVQPSSTSSEASSTSASATTSASPSPSTSASSANSAQKWRRLQLAHRVLQERLGESEDRAVQKREQARREADVEKNRAARVLQEAQEDRERVALRAQRERLARARGQEEPRGGAAAGPSAVTGSRSGAVYQQPPPGTRPEYRVNTSTHVGAESPRNLESSGEPGAVIDRSDYTAEVPFDDPSNRGDEAELDEEDEQGDKPPPYGREEWGSGRRLGS